MALTKEDLQAISDIMDERLDEKLDKKFDEKLQPIQDSITGLKLHLENITDKNIQLLAENHIDLVNKLNQAIPVANNNSAYEVKVNYLVEKVEILEKEVLKLKETMI